MRHMILLVTLTLVFPFTPLIVTAGTHGTLDGIVRDKTTGDPIPGVNVSLAELQRGTTTDPSGKFILQNIQAGRYEVRFSHIGHRTHLLTNVVINADLKTRLTVELEPTDVELSEVTVTQEKPLIQKDVTGTTFTVGGDEAILLPIDNVVDVVRLKPGVTLEGNIRGGKATEVLYLVDGLPVQDVMGGGLSATLPNSSITGLSIYTGGFEPEYGNALSGVVNIITKTGTNTHRVFVRADKDNLFGGKQVSKTNEFEASLSGPIIENTMYYFGAFSGALTDTRWWQDLQYFFGSPIDKTFSGFAKVEYLFSPTMRLAGQFMYNDHDWRDYEFNWRFDLGGLPPERRTANRVAAIFSHAVSESFFYTASLSRFYLRSSIGDGTKEDVQSFQPYQYDFFLQYIISGNRAWWSRSSQEMYAAKFDGTFKPGGDHMIKFGGELNLYNLNSDLVKLEPRKTFFGKPLVSEPQLDFSSAYQYKPRSGAAYIQDKIDMSDEGIVVNIGIRYDFLDPTASRPAIEAIPVADTAYRFNVAQTVKASVKQQFSPRLGASMQMTEKSYLFVNLGWYFQYPLFDYMYTGLDRVSIAKGIAALTGNPDLQPERTQAFEVSYRQILPFDLVASATYFKKETTNLVDTKTFVPGDSKLAGTFGFAEFVNTPVAEASGLEITISRERGDWIRGELSYTYMTAEGTSGNAYDGFYIAQFGLPPAARTFPLSWDQRHTVKLSASVITPWDLNVYLLAQYNSGRPYTSYPTATGFEPVNGGLFVENNARMPDYSNVDVRLEKLLRFAWWPNALLKIFLDVRNLLNTQNVKWVDSNGKVGGELGDPSGYYIGRRTRVGIQVEF
jgi:outer membrane receptor for ferrienterochelin and colicin